MEFAHGWDWLRKGGSRGVRGLVEEHALDACAGGRAKAWGYSAVRWRGFQRMLPGLARGGRVHDHLTEGRRDVDADGHVGGDLLE